MLSIIVLLLLLLFAIIGLIFEVWPILVAGFVVWIIIKILKD